MNLGFGQGKRERNNANIYIYQNMATWARVGMGFETEFDLFGAQLLFGPPSDTASFMVIDLAGEMSGDRKLGCRREP